MRIFPAPARLEAQHSAGYILKIRFARKEVQKPLEKGYTLGLKPAVRQVSARAASIARGKETVDVHA